MEVTDTGTRVNHQPQLRLRLSVVAPRREPYEVTVKKVVPRLSVARLRSGLSVPVGIDPGNQERVIVDWAALAQEPAGAGGAAWVSTGMFWTTEPGWRSAPAPPGSGTPACPVSRT